MQDSDATLILFTGSLTGGTKLTRDLGLRESKAVLAVDAAELSEARAIDVVESFIVEKNIGVLNVAGPRASGWHRGQEFAFCVIAGVICTMRSISAIGGARDEPR